MVFGYLNADVGNPFCRAPINPNARRVIDRLASAVIAELNLTKKDVLC